jgi:DNA-binding NarL/FixJ family response regulator
MIRILLADDHTIIRKGLKQILLDEYPSAIIEEANDAEEVIKKTMTTSYSIIICDLSMPGRSGMDVVLHMKQNCPEIPVLLLSLHPENQYGIRAIKAGAAGYLNKDAAPAELVTAVQRIVNGKKYISPYLAEKLTDNLVHDKLGKAAYEFLSNREFDIFKRIASGNRVYEIAERLSLSSSTVTGYRARILNKMGMKTNADMTRYCLDNQLT